MSLPPERNLTTSTGPLGRTSPQISVAYRLHGSGALLRIAGQVGDRSEFEFLELDFYDRDMRPVRVVLFDLDAVDEAIELLDAVHAEDAGPADPNAIARATEGWLMLRDQLLRSSALAHPEDSSAPRHTDISPPD